MVAIDAIILDGVVKKFTPAEDVPPALSALTARIKRGMITGLVGPDGAGKTTLMRMMAGLLAKTEGQLSVEGLDPIEQGDQLRALLGYMPQKFGLYEDLRVIENLNLYADLRGVIGSERSRVFEQLLNFTDLKRFTDRLAGKLSGGMKQKLGLACAMLGKPKVLLLDEPSVGVDPISRRELWKMVNELVTQGITVVWSTSYLDEAENCAEVLLMNEGKLIYYGTPQALTEKIKGRSLQVQNIAANHRLVLKRALRSQTVLDGVIQGQHVRLVLREADKKPPIEELEAGPNAKYVSVKPSFEDAFMDILGGGPGGDSVLSKVMQPVQMSDHLKVVIEANSLTKKFGAFTATDQVSFKVQRGEIFGLLGPNGAGKSTTFKMMCGLLIPTSGSAHVLGINLHESPSKARQQIGYMAQKFSLYGDLNVFQNLHFFSGIYGLSGAKQNERINAMVDAFDLKPLLHTTTNELPLGFKQRLALACAIMHEPAILFLDEPTSGVDPITRREFWTHINGLVEKGVTVMVTTHYMEEAEYCDHIGLVYRSKLIAAGTPDELKQSVATAQKPEPTMEDAFIDLVQQHDESLPQSNQTATTTEKSSISIDNKTARNNFLNTNDSLRRWAALCKKEFHQIIRDPSSILIAFVLPLIMLFLYGYGLNLDSAEIHIGLVMNDKSPEARHLAQTLIKSPYIDALPQENEAAARKELIAGNIRGFVTILPNFTQQLYRQNSIAPMQITTDGAEPNTANFVAGYATGAWQTWQQQQSVEKGTIIYNPISIESRNWFNPAVISRYFLVPGSIVIIMTVIGALLTSLVVAREWERGTMEALLSTPITRKELLLSKLIPYYLLGIGAMTVCLLFAVIILGTPFRGSVFLLFVGTSLFLGSALGIGLLLSTLLRNQFNAAQAALNIAFLPAIMFSGFVYEISSMPEIVQAVTYIFPARYFVSILQGLFLAGNIPVLLFKDGLFLFCSAAVFLGLSGKFTKRTLD